MGQDFPPRVQFPQDPLLPLPTLCTPGTTALRQRPHEEPSRWLEPPAEQPSHLTAAGQEQEEFLPRAISLQAQGLLATALSSETAPAELPTPPFTLVSKSKQCEHTRSLAPCSHHTASLEGQQASSRFLGTMAAARPVQGRAGLMMGGVLGSSRPSGGVLAPCVPWKRWAWLLSPPMALTTTAALCSQSLPAEEARMPQAQRAAPGHPAGYWMQLATGTVQLTAPASPDSHSPSACQGNAYQGFLDFPIRTHNCLQGLSPSQLTALPEAGPRPGASTQ